MLRTTNSLVQQLDAIRDNVTDIVIFQEDIVIFQEACAAAQEQSLLAAGSSEEDIMTVGCKLVQHNEEFRCLALSTLQVRSVHSAA